MSSKFWKGTFPEVVLVTVQVANALMLPALLLVIVLFPTACCPTQTSPVYVVRQYSGGQVVGEWKTYNKTSSSQGGITVTTVEGKWVHLIGDVSVVQEDQQ